MWGVMRTKVPPNVPRLCALAALLAATTLRGETWNFDTAGQLSNDFYAGSQGAVGSQTASGGLNNSGWVETSILPGGRGFQVTDQTFSGTTEAFSMSIYFQWRSNSLFAGEGLQLGIGRSTDSQTVFSPVGGGSSLIAPTSTQALSVGIGPRTTANDVRLYVSSMINGTNANLNQPGSPVTTLAPGNWYFMEVNFSLLASSNGFQYGVGLFNSSSAGVVSGGSLLSWTNAATNAGLTAGDLHAYFGTRNAEQVGIVGVDDFYVSAIPEPSTALLAIFGLAGALWFVRHRRARS